MKTTLVIDDELMQQALAATGLANQEEVVTLGLKTLIRLQKQAQIKSFRGKLQWDGNLDEIRGS